MINEVFLASRYQNCGHIKRSGFKEKGNGRKRYYYRGMEWGQR